MLSRAQDHRAAVTRHLAIVSVIAAVGVIVLYVLAIRTGAGQRFDDIAFAGRDLEDPEVTRLTNEVLHSVTRLTLGVLTLALVLLALSRGRLRLAVSVGAAVTISVVTTEALKLHILQRPVLDDVEGITINSYPSGHATIATALSLGLIMVTPHHRRWIAALVAIAFSCLFGVGVLATGWHRPSDAVGAVLVCVAVFGAVTSILIARRGVGNAELDGVEQWMRGPTLVVSVAVIAGVAVFALVETLRLDSVRTVEFAGDYVLVSVAILLFATSAIAWYVRVLRGISLDDHTDTT